MDAGIERAERFLEQNSLSVGAFNLKGRLLLGAGRPDEPEAAFQSAVESAGVPAYDDTRGWVYHRTGDSESAIRALERAVSRSPGTHSSTRSTSRNG